MRFWRRKCKVRSSHGPENNNKPVGIMSLRTGKGAEDKTFRSPEGVRLSAVSPTAIMSTGGEADALDLGEGLEVEGCVVLEGAVLPCVARVVTGLSDVVGMWRPLVVVRSMSRVETGTDIWLSRGSESVRVSLIGSGACVNKEGCSGLAREGRNAGMPWSSWVGRSRVVETTSSWMCVESERWSGSLHTGYEEGSHRITSLSLVEEEKLIGAESVSWCRAR